MKTNHVKRTVSTTLPQRRALRWVTVLTAAWFALPAMGRDCYRWVQRTDVGSYGQRWGHAMAYDSDRGVTVFFGGERGLDGSKEYFDDTQEYDGKMWRQITVAGTKPSPRSFHAMAYDPVRKRVVLAGGERIGLERPGGGYAYNDAWLYTSDGTNGFWERLPTVFSDRSGHGMVYNRVSQRVLSVQGSDVCTALLNCFTGAISPYEELVGETDTWVSIFELSPSVPTSWGVGAVFDESRGVVLALGGKENVWEEYIPDVGVRPLSQQLGFRSLVAAAYDGERARVVVVGGVGDSPSIGEEVFEYDPTPGRGWVTLPPLPTGQGRAGARMVYDGKRRVMVLTGGAGGGAPDWEDGGRFSDTWELVPVRLPELSISPSDPVGEVCGSVTLQLQAQGVPNLLDLGSLRYQWRLDGAPIRDDARVTGATTSSLTVQSIQQGDAGSYHLVVFDDECRLTSVTSRVARLTVNPGLEWVFRATNGPSARAGHAMVYDSYRRVSVLFGGRRLGSNGPTSIYADGLNDLWEWNGAAWKLRLASTKTNGWSYSGSFGWRPTYADRPVQRAFHAMAYDLRRDRLVVFGGNAIDPDGRLNYDTPLDDLWEWDGDRWHFMGRDADTWDGPPRRTNGSMAYDERRGRIVFFGGFRNEADDDLLVIWEWDGAHWYRGQTLPARNTQDPGSMVYDPFHRTVVYGPAVSSQGVWRFWSWDGESWSSPLTGPPWDPVAYTLDGTRDGAMAHDRARRRTQWFGGWRSGLRNETALFDGTNWTLLASSAVSLPSPRKDLAMAYDPIRQVTVLFGGDILGFNQGVATNDTWELAAIDKPLISEAPMPQILRLGDTTVFHTAARGAPLTYQWYRTDRSMALSDSDRFSGTQSDALTIHDTQLADAGYYHVEVRNLCGVTASQPVALEYNPRFGVRVAPGFDFSAETRGGRTEVVWPEENAILEQALSPEGPWEALEGATSPYIPGAVARARFFRLRFGTGP